MEDSTKTARSHRIQYEGANGILCLLNRGELEQNIDWQARIVARHNELRKSCLRAKVMGKTIDGETIHDTIFEAHHEV